MAKKTKKAKATTAKKHVTVPMHSVVHFVRMLHDEKHAAKFTKAAREANAAVTLAPDTVDFVKKFLEDRKLHTAMARTVVDPCPGDPFECHFRD